MTANKPISVLAFFAHPDDEVMLAGGTLALLAEAGAQIHYLCATRGEGGELGEPPLSTREELGDLREQEMVCAVQPLGARSLTFLGFTDPTVGDGDELFPFTDDITFLAGQVTASIQQVKADIVISHGVDGEYGHPAHIVCHQAALTAVMALAEDAPVLYSPMAVYAEHPKPRLANQSQLADYILDVKPVLEKKIKSAMCHKTQHALFVRRTAEDLGRPVEIHEVVLQEESLQRVYPPEISPDPVFEILQSTGAIRENKEAK